MSQASDRWLWFGLGLLAVAAIKGISYGLREVVRLTEIHKPSNEAPTSSTTKRVAAADSIHINSLITLAKSSNVQIAEAATHMLCDRFTRSQACMRALAIDLISTDRSVRHRATKTRIMLEENSSGGHSIFVPYRRDSESRLLVAAEQGIADMPVLPSVQVRPHDESEAEQALRRRRREAMVLHEGSGPLSQNDIHQRLGATVAEGTTIADEATTAEEPNILEETMTAEAPVDEYEGFPGLAERVNTILARNPIRGMENQQRGIAPEPLLIRGQPVDIESVINSLGAVVERNAERMARARLNMPAPPDMGAWNEMFDQAESDSDDDDDDDDE